MKINTKVSTITKQIDTVRTVVGVQWPHPTLGLQPPLTAQTKFTHEALPGHKPHTITTVVVLAPMVALITPRPGAVRAAVLEAERHVADGVVLGIVQATVTQQSGFQISSVLDYRSWISCR